MITTVPMCLKNGYPGHLSLLRHRHNQTLRIRVLEYGPCKWVIYLYIYHLKSKTWFRPIGVFACAPTLATHGSLPTFSPFLFCTGFNYGCLSSKDFGAAPHQNSRVRTQTVALLPLPTPPLPCLARPSQGSAPATGTSTWQLI